MKKKGEPKTGGRRRGQPNKVTRELRTRIKSFIDDHWSQFETDYEKLDPLQRMQFIERLLPYSVPKLKEADLRVTLERLTDAEIDLIIAKLLPDD